MSSHYKNGHYLLANRTVIAYFLNYTLFNCQITAEIADYTKEVKIV